jgi:hypothetical protein
VYAHVHLTRVQQQQQCVYVRLLTLSGVGGCAGGAQGFVRLCVFWGFVREHCSGSGFTRVVVGGRAFLTMVTRPGTRGGFG